ncbi:S8 family serine peptidase, partial [uncultured Ezakiella sp.]|uniref:S8 family serine peptidase n=1 Tax=uncultured Ezakiella sp. TaxID=1637529 RepID=UPI0025F7E834
MTKKFTAVLLSIFMILGLFNPFFNLKAEGNEVNVHQRPSQIENAKDIMALDEIEDKDEVKSFIFVTDESPKVAEKLNEVYEVLNADEVAQKGNEYLMEAGFNDAISKALGNLDYNLEVKDKIKDLLGKSKGGLLETMSSIFGGSSRDEYNDSEDRNFNVVFSGFTMKMTTKEAIKVRENVPEVKQIFVDYKYNRPEAKPNMYNSTKMVHAPQVWDLGYKGQGRVVAVIDSGADINHPAMRLSDESKVALTQEKVEKLIQDKLLKGQYLNAKFPYGYNFMDNNMDLKDTNKDTGMHGMHVSGTVGANATKEEADANNGGLVVKGVAPEAQILVMRVFGQEEALTNTSAYIEAIEESIILGADSMNMSLGSMSGSEQGIDPGMDLTLQNARKAGSIVAIAGGNDFYTTWGFDNPRATNPDWGVMGTPGVAESAFTVANYNNDSMVTDASTFIINEKGEEEEVIAKPIDTIDTIVDTGFVSMKEYEIVDVGYGNKESEYNGQDVSGKVVLAYRGKDPKDKDDTSYSANFSAKIELAKKKGAVAFLLGNNQADKPDYFIIMTTETDGLIESYSVTYRSYKAIKQNIEDAKKAGVKPTIKINTKRHGLANPGVHKMNESTSWGPNPSLRLKPEITAPGGEIFSTVNDGKYQSMTGTSMATPHVAGGVALVNEFLAKNNIKVEGPEKHQFIKNIMMATATPILYENKGGFYNSPRVQGSGLMNLEAALNPNIVTVVDAGQEMSRGKAVVEFGSINDEKLDFTLKLRNYSDKPVSYNVRGIAQTDEVKDGKVTFAPVKLGEASFGQVRVEENSEATFNGSIDLTGKLEYAKRNQPNGFFVEGFIFFDVKADGEGAKEFANLSVPYLAFYGDWAKLPIIDVFADEISLQETGNGKVWIDNIPFWYQGSDYKDFPGRYVDQWNFTHFYSRWSDGGRVIQGQQLWSNKYLDTFAISPNGDSKKDDIAFRGVFLRNADSLKFEFINEAGEVVKTIAEPYRSVIRKNSYKQKFTEDSVWTWRGEDKNGGQVPDGNYKVRITASAQDNKSSEQEYVRTVYVDRVKPEIELLKAEQDGNLVDIEFKAKDDRSGISYMGVYDFIDSNKKEYPYTFEYRQDGEYLVYKAQFTVEDGYSFEANKGGIWIGAMDMAGNYFETTLASNENKGKVIFELKSSDPDDQSFPKELPRLDYKVVENGQDKWYYTTYTNNLMYTDYKVYYPDPFPGYNVEFKPREFTLSDDNQEQKVEVIFTKIDDKDFGSLDVYIDNALDYRGEITLFAVANYGTDNEVWYKIPRKGSYARDAFGVKLPAGEYTIIAEGTGADAPVLEIGRKKFLVKPRELTEVGTRLVWNNHLLSFYFGTYVNSLDDIFENDIIEKKSTDKAGKEVYSYTLDNFNKYFDVIDMAADKIVNIDKADLLNFHYNPDEKYEEVRIDIFINLSGKYKVVPKFDLATISSNVPNIEVWSNFNDKTYKDNAGYMYVYPNGQDKGSLKVTTEFVTKKNVDKPNVMYELYNSRNEFVNESEWDNLPQGIYYLRTKIFDGFRPEREEYKIEIYKDKKVDKLNQKLNVRWFHIGEESERKNPIVEFGVNGANAADYGEDIKITLVNVEDNKTYEVSVPIGKSIKELIPNGIYKMTVNLKDGWDYIYFTDKGNGGDRRQGDPDEVALTQSFNYIELALRRTNKPDYSTDYKLVIEEDGLDPGANRPKYYIVDNNDKDNYSYTDKAEFINLTPGEYTLYVKLAPTGYEADPMEQVVTITEGENVATAKVTYTIEEGRLLLSPLAKAIENAKRLLENDKKLTDEYRRDLEALVKDGEDYLAKDDKTQDGIFEKAKKINDMVNNPKHKVEPKPEPHPEPKPEPQPEPKPYNPGYRYQPSEEFKPAPRPVEKPKEEKKEEKKTEVKPVEEKKDYGIIETRPSENVEFTDLPDD